MTFDIDANGIVHVAAKDRATNKEQSMTITGQSTLDKDDIDQMVKDAEAHAEEDKARREGLKFVTTQTPRTRPRKCFESRARTSPTKRKLQLRDHSLNSRLPLKAPTLQRSRKQPRTHGVSQEFSQKLYEAAARDNAAELQHQDLQMSQQMMTSLMLRLSTSNE